MADADRAINEILGQDNVQTNRSRRISYYERVKAELMDTLKKIDEEEEMATREMTETYERYGIKNFDWEADECGLFGERRGCGNRTGPHGAVGRRCAITRNQSLS